MGNDTNKYYAKVHGFSDSLKEQELERLKKDLDKQGCSYVDCDKSLNPWVATFEAPEGFQPMKWFDRKGYVFFWLFLFAPLGIYGLFKSNTFNALTKAALSSLIILIYSVSIYSGQASESEAQGLGFKNRSDYERAMNLNIADASKYYKVIQQEEQQKQEAALQKIELKRLAEEEKASQELAQKDLSNTAMVMCKEFVKSYLVSPSSADFGWPDEFLKFRKENQRYIIKSHVDSQNQFGATIRSNWHCQVKYIGDGNDIYHPQNWKLEKMEII
ncbi:hypothetical protein [Marinomonas atlantica]|uniref:hypothetical protein n=1 Tax=Marinomonas atlantica TaxID=1806668 RepID=UPI000830D75E|nr:hypothetical protein [Marinomonas atlantica]